MEIIKLILVDFRDRQKFWIYGIFYSYSIIIIRCQEKKGDVKITKDVKRVRNLPRITRTLEKLSKN